MNIVVTHFGNISQLIPVTSVIMGIKKQKINTNITMVVSKKEFCYIYKYNKNIDRTITLEQFSKEYQAYDLLVNLFSYFPDSLYINPEIRQATGFYFFKEYDRFKKALTGEQKFPEMSILQLYYILAGLTWKGEGYDLGYLPKTKTHKNRIGVSVANANIRNYVLDNLEIDNKKIWYIPYKKNIFKKMDEINKCKKIITDDLTTFHLSIAMRKYVYYLETYPLNLKLEFFNRGEIYKVPMSLF